MQIDHYKRFATRWSNELKFKRESITVILSPHVDDVFLSLYDHIVSGSLGRNITCINFFTASDSTVKTRTGLSFGSVADASTTRMMEELRFSEHLASKEISYLPSFLGLRDAALNDYYRFIFSGAASKYTKRPVRSMHSLNGYYNMLDLPTVVERLIAQYKRNVSAIMMPMGLSSHRDHMLFTRLNEELDSNVRVGLYCDIPYIYKFGYNSVEKLKQLAPDGYAKITTKNADAAAKIRAFRSIYPSQYDRSMRDALDGISKTTGEVVFWYS